MRYTWIKKTILRALADRPHQTADEIALRNKLKVSTVTANLLQMRDAGWVEYSPRRPGDPHYINPHRLGPSAPHPGTYR